MGLNTPVQLIPQQTAAETTQQKYKITADRCPTTIMADNLAGAEEVDIYFSVDGGTTWETLFVDGLAVKLTATDNAKTFFGPMLIGVTKDATAGACGVFAATANK